MQSSPDILWILTDQFHADAMRHVGRRDVHTPNLDALAADGIGFDRAYCNSPICGPSRCSMIAGRYPCDTGITANAIFEANEPLPPGGTVATRLREAGYETSLVGKGHMIEAWDQAGFEHRDYCDLCDASRGDPASVGYFQYLIDQGLADEYDLGNRIEGQPGFQLEGWVSELDEEHTVEAWTGRQALQRWRGRDGRRPFFMQWSFQRPHEPLCIPPQRVDDYSPDSIELPDSRTDYFDRRFEGKPFFQQDYIQDTTRGYPYRPVDEADLKRQLARYYTLITMIDKQVGDLVDELKAAGRYENTLIIFTADHGDFAGDHGLMLKNLGIYESIQRVPLIVKPAAVQSTNHYLRGTRCDNLVELVDLMPTILASAGVDVPSDLPGRNLLSLASDQVPKRDHVVCEFEFNQRQPCAIAVRDEHYRFVIYPWDSNEPGELYDHRTDPGEVNNLISSPNLLETRLRLTEKALCHMSLHRRRRSFAQDINETLSLRRLVQAKGLPYSHLV